VQQGSVSEPAANALIEAGASPGSLPLKSGAFLCLHAFRFRGKRDEFLLFLLGVNTYTTITKVRHFRNNIAPDISYNSSLPTRPNGTCGRLL
jgi:hypothetical protein